MIRLKTSVLIAASLKMGGIVAGASESDLENLYAYGETMGLAFQLQDDLLDVYGDAALFGKKIGGDIRCNKKTFLLIKAMELASPEQRAEMLAWMENPVADDDAKVAYFTSLYTSLGIKEVCEKRIAELFAKCDAFIENLSVSAERKANLKAFADFLLARNL